MILLTGATGYVGSHVWVELLRNHFQVIGLDNFSNSSRKSLEEIFAASGQSPNFIRGDIRDEALLEDIFTKNIVTHVIHLAALKDAQESMVKQAEYFDVNVRGLQCLLRIMRANSCMKIVFSSSAAIYGAEAASPVSEDIIPMPFNYYGEAKLEGEYLLAQEFQKHSPIYSVSLRYFNVAGRDSSGLLLDNQLEQSNSLFSKIEQVLLGDCEYLKIFGADWATSDGTCIRDYIHVSDLAKGHIDALRLLDRVNGLYALNLGSGVGQSVNDVLSTYERSTGISIPAKVAPRRSGDVKCSFADIRLAAHLMDWEPTKTLQDMCTDSFSSLDTRRSQDSA